MTVIRGKNKIANKSTGGCMKAGLAPSIGKSKMMRDKSNTKSVVNLKNDNMMFQPPAPPKNSKFFFYADAKPNESNKPIYIDDLLQNSKTIFADKFSEKYFAAFVLKSPDNMSSTFLYNKPNSPYNFFSCTFSINDNVNEFLKIQLPPGKVIKIIFSNPMFHNISEFSSITIDNFIKTRIPYSQINKLSKQEQNNIEETTKLLTGYNRLEVWYKDKFDKNNVLCNFLPTEGAGIYEYELSIKKHFNLPQGYSLSLFTHKIIN